MNDDSLMEKSLWLRIANDDVNAISQLYKKYYQYLFVYGFRICADKELTKDCIHESFLEIWNNRHKLSKVEHFGAYLKTIVRRKVFKEVPVSRYHTIDLSEVLDKDIEMQFPYEHLLIELQSENEMRVRVERALKKLTPKQLEVIKMKFYEDKTYNEIATITSTTPRTVYNQVFESLKILRRYLNSLLISLLF
jgi:RNA polymerase sigma factor (sigma-70 family)